MKRTKSANARRPMLFLLVILLIGHVFLPNQAGAKEGSLPPAMGLATHPVGSLFYTLGSGFAKLLTERLPTTVSVQPFTSSGAWFPMVDSGELMLGIINNYDPWAAYRGLPPYKERYPNLRFLCTGPSLKLSYLVATSSPFKTVADLKGKRAAYGKGMPGQRFWAEGVLEAAGLKPGVDVKVVPTPDIVAPVRAIMDGRADAGAAATGMAVVTEAAAKLKGVRYLPAATTPEEVRVVEASGPCEICVQKKGPPGVAEDTPLVCMKMNFLASKQLSEEGAYQVVKAIWDHHEDLIPVHVVFRQLTHATMIHKKPVVPYHDGAIRFFKEKNLWTDELEKKQKEMLAQ